MIPDLRFYLRLLSRRFPAMAFLIVLASCVGLVMALRLPTTYSTSATLLVESAQIPDEMIRSTINVEAAEQLEVIQRRLMTRANLIQVARDNNVFPNQRRMNPDDVVSEMRRKTKVRRASGRNRATVMTISFEGRSPQVVAAVVSQYVTIVLAANSDFREERTAGTLDFFEQEVAALSASLDEQSAKIVAFKNENVDALPENLEFRMGRRATLQDRISRIRRDIEAIEAQKINIQRVYENTGTLTDSRRVKLSPEAARLKRLQGELRVALSVYSETNPKVKILRNQIETLTAQMRAAGEAIAEEGGSPLDAVLEEMDGEIAELELQIEEAKAELEELADGIARTPANRILLEAMERERRSLQGLYGGAAQRLSQARLGERVEVSARGERITVLEPATVPNTPSGPNRAAIMSSGVAAGMGLAGGLFVLLELLNLSIRRPTDITKVLGITPLATLPRFESQADRRRRRTLQLLTLAAVIVAVPTSLWLVDTYYMPLDVLFEKVRERLF
ncbi:lipopolysaccharide biosynthesis [uncultured Roseobacter sp.]|uniref:GumC family protein n=1 Tax=uncultured Roseobacter sp. TaxID=114847 RepID=UPI002625EC53|nr:lipopolysaccharide biosynthesis [uncultured Roseobacter sp.]